MTGPNQGVHRAAVAFFIFNRPATTLKVFRAIAAARPPKLFVIADGPRADRPGEEALCREARAVIDAVDWPCALRTNYSETNLGCKTRISSGLDWVFSQTDEAIILEDDCLPEPGFFPFCEQLLERYRGDERVHMIRGSNLLQGRRFTDDSYYFSRFYNIWGWATWARAWKHYDIAMREWPRLRDSDWLPQMLPTKAMADMAHYFFEETHARDRFTTWDYQWVFSGWQRNALCAVPSSNLVTNIGFGEGATHTQSADTPLARLATAPLAFPLTHPADVQVLESADRHEWELLNPDAARRQSLWDRVRGRLPQPLRSSLRRRLLGRSKRDGQRADPRASTSKTLVLGAAIGYTAAQIAPFLLSLRKAGYCGDVALMVDPQKMAGARTSPLFEGVTLIAARQWLPVRYRLFWGRRRWALAALWVPLRSLLWVLLRVAAKLPLGQARGRLQLRLAATLYAPTEGRYLRAMEFIEAHAHSRILLTDVRDVVFQGDPFKHMPGTGLAVSMESPSHTLATEPFNAGWIKLAGGAAMLRQIGDRPVSCSGVTGGDRASILHYLRLMNREILGLGLRAAGQSGVDQGIHNILVWTGQLGEIHRLETLASPVATLGAVDPADLKLDEYGRLLNRDGSVVGILHQYDRQESLKPIVLRPLIGTLAQ